MKSNSLPAGGLPQGDKFQIPHFASPSHKAMELHSKALRGEQNSKQRGIAVLLAVLLLGTIFAVGSGIAILMLREIAFTRGSNNFAIAFFAADTGIEKVLINRSAPVSIPTTFFANGASYTVIVTPAGATKPDGNHCEANNYCVKSTGEFGGTRRAVEVSY